MDNPEQYLLNKKALINLQYIKREAEREYDKILPTWEVIGKYHQRLWFQKLWQKNERELIFEYQCLAIQLDRLEATIEEQKLAFFLHSSAIEILHASNMPFKNIHLQQHTLTQKELF